MATDMHEAAAAIERLAAVPTDLGFVLNEITLLRLRALLARAHGDDTAHRDYRDRYRDMATRLGFEGHIAWAEEMPRRRSIGRPAHQCLITDDIRESQNFVSKMARRYGGHR